MALQVWRVGGLFFLVEWARGHLPGGFALPAGIGDVLVGLTAPLVAAGLARHQGERAFAWWNGLGLLDLVVAVGDRRAARQRAAGSPDRRRALGRGGALP